MESERRLVERLDERIRACRELPFQLTGGPHQRLIDQVRDQHVLLNARRSGRPRDEGMDCYFCRGQTPPTLFYVKEEGGNSGLTPPVVETEQQSLARARRYLGSLPAGEEPDPWQVLHLLGDADPGEREPAEPLVHPGEPWLARVFLNFVPLLVDPASAANCFVISVPPDFHHCDLGSLLADKGLIDHPRVLPVAVVEALVRSWQLLEEWCVQRGLTAVPFINGGKSRASGQSLDHFHSQLYALGPADQPPLYQRLGGLRGTACPVCALLAEEELRVRTFGSVAVAVHPAPARDLTLVVAPLGDLPLLSQVAAGDLAAAISWAVKTYESLLGGVPAYIVGLRTGDLVGHLHAEVVPRSGVNIPGGFEETTGLAVTTRDPREVARFLRETLGEGDDRRGSEEGLA